MARDDEIRAIAYGIWQEEGCCDGRDLADWLRAEVIWEQQAQKESSPKASPDATSRTSKPKVRTKRPVKR